MDAVQRANSGHPGTPMALAPLRPLLPLVGGDEVFWLLALSQNLDRRQAEISDELIESRRGRFIDPRHRAGRRLNARAS